MLFYVKFNFDFFLPPDEQTKTFIQCFLNLTNSVTLKILYRLDVLDVDCQTQGPQSTSITF
jgi:hypothetical protein